MLLKFLEWRLPGNFCTSWKSENPAGLAAATILSLGWQAATVPPCTAQAPPMSVPSIPGAVTDRHTYSWKSLLGEAGEQVFGVLPHWKLYLEIVKGWWEFKGLVSLWGNGKIHAVVSKPCSHESTMQTKEKLSCVCFMAFNVSITGLLTLWK